ncbi:MAG: bifunctional heptose 7-phosphate kinase/heptose 1-phosphate adenyltransferase [Phycisphaerales bacterium]|jgi:D-beta-D-heptose 7-phosphate kinase/D-beta-D-heptose 1-phosphate adenosyltransferase|nr:bifunctional heptose 7-phosphate kinase/heptose 1-phosphate adenyltransferase [Phycisphaerales bacterium]
MDSLLEHVARWKPFTALVVGDFMLDQLVYGDAERLSADAPVPILHVSSREDRPGGSANVCLDLVALKGKVLAMGVTGNDDAARALRDSLSSQGVDVAGLVIDPSRPTTVKQNLIGKAQARHPQKMFRVDYESREPLSSEVVAELLATFERSLPSVDVVCIEDYDKGVCTPEFCQGVIRAARRAGKPVFVDPARLDDYSKYRGAAAITPNRTEAETATGLRTHGEASGEHNRELAEKLLHECELDAVVLTLDRHGAMLQERGGEPLSVPTIARQVYDVTGAGDMFLAGLAAARANAIDWADAVRFANAAAGLEVEVFGVQPIPLEKVHLSLLSIVRAGGGKLRTMRELLVEVAEVKRRGGKVVFTNGCFDVLHAGHVALLDFAKSRGNFLIVATNTDQKVREYKGPNRPVNMLEDRITVLSGIASVDAVMVFEEDTPVESIDRVRPDVLVKGSEYSEAEIPGAALVKQYGGEVVRFAMQKTLSTTEVLRRSGDPRHEVETRVDTRARFVEDK